MIETLTHFSSNALILWILIACSFIGGSIFIERLLVLRRSQINTNQFIIDIRESIQEGNIIQAVQFCEQTGGALAAVLKAGLLRHHHPQDKIERSMEAAGRLEIAHLEKNAKILSIISHIAPLIGLLGTVLGFMQAFAEMKLSGMVDITATRIGDALEYALLTTAAGLVVAIPALIAFNYLVSRIEAFVLEIQTLSTEIVDLLMNSQQKHAF